MGNRLGRPLAGLAAAALVVAGFTATNSAQAASTTVSGSLKTSAGAGAGGVQIALCTQECFNGGTAAGSGSAARNGSFSFKASTSPSKYVWAVSGLHTASGYSQAPQSGYLRKESGGSWSVVRGFAAATKISRPTSAQTLTLAKAIRSSSNKFAAVTKGTKVGHPCAWHPTTFTASALSNFPSNGKIAYQWYVGNSVKTMKPISGARAKTYTPTAAMTGKTLFMSIIASAPNRVNYDQVGRLGKVGNPATCAPKLATIPASWVASYGVKKGSAKVGSTVRVAGAKARSGQDLTKHYLWKAGTRVIGTSDRVKVPASAKGKKLTVKVSFARSGYKTKAKTLSYGHVK